MTVLSRVSHFSNESFFLYKCPTYFQSALMCTYYVFAHQLDQDIYTVNRRLTYCDKKDGFMQAAISRLREICLDQDCYSLLRLLLSRPVCWHGPVA